MPFVIVAANKPFNVLTTLVLEHYCKEAWASMCGFTHNTGCLPEDVGGIVHLNPDSTKLFTITFYYVDRGADFDVELKKRLVERFTSLIRVEGGFEVITVPTQAEGWFKDPVWSQTQCQRPHQEGLPPSGYDDGWR